MWSVTGEEDLASGDSSESLEYDIAVQNGRTTQRVQFSLPRRHQKKPKFLMIFYEKAPFSYKNPRTELTNLNKFHPSISPFFAGKSL
jgi:hypothetical protein